MDLPLADPQFWLVTAAVAAVALLATRRVRRSLRSDAGSPCASCPKVAAVAGGAVGEKKNRLRVVSMLALALLPAISRAASVERSVASTAAAHSVVVEIATDRTVVDGADPVRVQPARAPRSE